MSVIFDPNDELFRSFLVNDLKSVSSITTKACVKECLVQENIKCSHCDVMLKDPLERAQHEKTHFTFECKYCYSLFVRQSDLTRHLETSHKMKSLLLWLQSKIIWAVKQSVAFFKTQVLPPLTSPGCVLCVWVSDMPLSFWKLLLDISRGQILSPAQIINIQTWWDTCS